MTRDELRVAVALASQLQEAQRQAARLREALIRLRDCDWTIGRGDRMDPVRDIARAALAGEPRHD